MVVFRTPIPVDFSRSLGFDKLIVILTQPIDYRKKPSSGRVYRLLYKKYPKFVAVASKRYQHYNDTVEKIIQLEHQGQVFAVRPQKPLEIGRLEKNPVKFDEIYGLGLADGEKAVARLMGYLGNEE